METSSLYYTPQPLKNEEPRAELESQPKTKPQPQPKRRPFKNIDSDFDHFAGSSLQLSLWDQYQSGKYTDLTVTCGSRSFQVHKVVVCAQSSFFDAACGQQFKESVENKIELPDEDPEMIERLFQFLYLGNYTDGEYFDELPSVPALMKARDVEDRLNEASGLQIFSAQHFENNDSPSDADYNSDRDSNIGKQSTASLEHDSACSDGPTDSEDDEKPYLDDCPIQLFTSLRMYIIGDKYDIPALQLLAKKRFICTAQHHWKRYEDFPNVVDELFMTTTSVDPLRSFVCALIQRDYLGDSSVERRMRPVVQSHPDLTLELLDVIVANARIDTPYSSEVHNKD